MALTNYDRNLDVDWKYRGQARIPPASRWAALLTAASAAGGTEQTAGGVARVEIPSSLTDWSGTQGAGTTAASSGTAGTFSNNVALSFAASASALISAGFVGLFDADVGGNLLEWHPIRNSEGAAITRTWQIGDPVVLPAGALQITVGDA